MKITRLDKIIENNVTLSTQKGNQEQIIYLLQDISTTLAMIYDKMCGEATVSDASVSVVAFVIPFDELEKYDTLYIEYRENENGLGYETKFLRYDEEEIIDVKRNEKRVIKSAVFDAFGYEMKCDEKQCLKDWRCWNIAPTEEEKKKAKWEK